MGESFNLPSPVKTFLFVSSKNGFWHVRELFVSAGYATLHVLKIFACAICNALINVLYLFKEHHLPFEHMQELLCERPTNLLNFLVCLQ